MLEQRVQLILPAKERQVFFQLEVDGDEGWIGWARDGSLSRTGSHLSLKDLIIERRCLRIGRDTELCFHDIFTSLVLAQGFMTAPG
jgi:hypothetical protein